MENTIELILAELDRLQVSTDHNPMSGLMVEMAGENRIRVYDDYVDGIYNAQTLITLLNAVEDHTHVTLASTYLEDIRNIWDVIRPAEIDED